LRRQWPVCDDFIVVTRRGPSLAKAGIPPLIERRGDMVRTTEGRWRELFDAADMVSEGATKEEPDGDRTWYGSTSLILELPVETSLEDRAQLLAIAQKDVHAHVHALRSAHREAQSRAPAMLGRITCELRFSDDPKGLRIDVDVQAPLIERRRVNRTLP
jgi:hypothetical protein